MSKNTEAMDIARAHRYFSADCFNRTWTLIEKPDRTPADDEQMIFTAMASMWHWTQRDDCTEQNLSIGYWQLSRVYALAGQGQSAMRYAEQCLDYSADCAPFFLGYAHEAIARAALVLGDRATYQMHLQQARDLAATVQEPGERKLLEDDLESMG